MLSDVYDTYDIYDTQIEKTNFYIYTKDHANSDPLKDAFAL